MKTLKQALFYLAVLFVGLGCTPSTQNVSTDPWIISAPAGSNYSKMDPSGESITPLGRILSPRGKQIQVAPHPYGLTLSQDGTIAVTANSGTSPLSITIIKNIFSDKPTIKQIPEGAETNDEVLASVFMGVAISSDNKLVYVAGGQENKVFIFDIDSGEKKGFIDCAVKNESVDYSHGYIGDMILSKDGKKLYVLDQINFRMLVIDPEKREILASVDTGRYPFGICLSPDEHTAYIANVGMYEYKIFRHVDPKNLKGTSKDYPAFAYLSKESEEGIKNDSVDIPGLGKANGPESFSVWAVDLKANKVTSKIKTGILVGHKFKEVPAVGGSSPNSLVATDKQIFVSNGNNDCISVIDAKKGVVTDTLFLSPDERLGDFRGILPFGLTLSPDQKRLFVAESGINALAVVDVASLKVLGHIPTGWFPAKVKTSPDGKKLIVTNAKGLGSGPNGGSTFKKGPEGSYVGALMKGSVSVMDIPSDEELTKTTQQVINNNFKFEKASSAKFTARKDNPVPTYPKQKESPIKYIVFISKENRTYDEVFGQLKKGKGEATLARYGYKASFSNRANTSSVKDADIMVNHLALAKRFAISDNFYVNSDHSADGHRWLVNTYPNQWMETGVSAAYGGNREFREDSKAKGNLSFVGASGAIYPEDYNEGGAIWEHLERNGLEFFNFGFGVEMAATYSDSTLKYAGVRYLANYPLPAPLYSRTSKKYATYNMAIPDQFRVDVFKQEFEEKWMGKGKTLPAMLTLILPNDHGAGDRPQAGFPYRESYMADNDLALGRIVEYLSNTPYWKNMAIVVTEDDSQDGVDHVDAHRSILMVISPYAKKDYIGHEHYSFGSIFKTFWNILGTPYLNQYDAVATDMADLFTDKPDFSPYRALPVDPRVFDPQKALDPFDEKFDWKAMLDSPNLDDPADFKKSSDERDKKVAQNK
ncbi:MAG: alkaline phosphatase family protein [Microscillaceae bacterium]|nr:alkaline phosphatase family protein [Microscillaceae bacterium]